ncbi:MAG: TolC family protein [Candidatus Azobacteroides sp.]|nr:TolC family protein [Candidatus Azobacteroides sp.]
MKNIHLNKWGWGILFFGITLFLRAQHTPEEVSGPLSFDAYLLSVERYNANYLAEKYNVRIAEEETEAQKVIPDPELTFEGGEDCFNLELGFTVETGNKRGSRIRLAKGIADMEALALEIFFQELRAEASEAFLNALLQKQLLEVKKSSYQYMLQLSQSDSIRFRLGEIPENEALQSKLEAATLLNELFEQEGEYYSALSLLNMYMGKAPATPVELVEAWKEFDRDYTLTDLISAGLAYRTDLMLADKSVQVATDYLRNIKAERKMDLDLSIGYERDWKGFLPQRDMITAGVTIPLKFSNTNKGEIRAAKYQIEQTRHKRRDTELQIELEITQAYYEFQVAKRQVKQYDSGMLEDSRRVLEGIVYSYTRGETGILEVLIARRTYNEVQEEYLNTLKGYASALVNLEKACGIWDLSF